MNVRWDKSWVGNTGTSSFYGVLAVNRFAGAKEIKRGYRSKALEYHPDRNPNDAHAEAMFKNVNNAYQVLSDPQKRIRYNSMLDMSARDGQLFTIVVRELCNNDFSFGKEAYCTLRELYQHDGNFDRLYNARHGETVNDETVQEPTWSDIVNDAAQSCYDTVSRGYNGLVSRIKNFPWKTSAKVAAGIAGLGIGYHIAMSDIVQDRVQNVPLEEIVEPCESARMDYMNANTDVERINARHQIKQSCK